MGCANNSDKKEGFNLEENYKQKNGPTMWADDT